MTQPIPAERKATSELILEDCPSVSERVVRDNIFEKPRNEKPSTIDSSFSIAKSAVAKDSKKPVKLAD